MRDVRHWSDKAGRCPSSNWKITGSRCRPPKPTASANADLRSIRIKLAQTRIVAVDDGIISGRKALLGDVVSAGSEMFRMIRDGRIEWQAELDAQQLPGVKAGQLARVMLPGGIEVEGRVRLVSPMLDGKTSRALVYVSLPIGSMARAGMYASGRIELPSSPALTVPDTSVILRDGRSYVFVLGRTCASASRW